jgi:hypothetical protein
MILQFDVIARDPSGKEGSAVVRVQVIRDQPPQFQNTPYRTTIVESQQTNARFFTVSASDPDQKVSIGYIFTRVAIKVNLVEIYIFS